MKIMVGLSGGVDSSVAAALLQEQGHEVMGVMMKIWKGKTDIKVKRSACYGPDEKKDIEDAREVAHFLKIPFHLIDLSEEYDKVILSYFKAEYASGRTPNPCVKCNAGMKFGLLVDRALKAFPEYKFFATGHYVRKEERNGRFLLRKGMDERKDQSYFLTFLTQEQIKHSLFPLGELNKATVFEMARKYGLNTAEKKESQDFYAGDIQDLLDFKQNSGDIVNKRGEVLGKHRGLAHYTVGQRRGIGVSAERPLYVIRLDKEHDRVVVGFEEELFLSEFWIENSNWIAIETLRKPMDVKVKIRYRHQEVPARIVPDGDKVRVQCVEPQKAITPGQIAVFYDNNVVVGGGFIS